MSRYFSTFLSGLGGIVEKWLREDVADIQITRLQDGLVEYRTLYPSHAIEKIRYLNNSYLLISDYTLDQNLSDAKKALDLLYKDASLDRKIASLGLVKGKYFKVVLLRENEMVSVDQGYLDMLHTKIKRILKLKREEFRKGREFWLMIRRNGELFFGLRITSSKKQLERGELRVELANTLCRLSEPKPGDVFLEPFCGSGSIFLERVSSFPYKFAYAVDSDAQKVTQIQRKVAWTKDKIKVFAGDGLNLNIISNSSVDKVVTDPPWGLFAQVEDISQFYTRMILESIRVLKQDGLLVMLVSRDIPLEDIVKERLELKQLERIDILVSGQKSTIFKFLRL